MKKLILLIIPIIIIVNGCSSGKVILERGQYEEAVYQSVKRLQQKPGHQKASQVLITAYPLAVKELMREIEFLDKENRADKHTLIANKYQRIENMNLAIRRYPNFDKLVALTDVQGELICSKRNAANTHFNNGVELLSKGNKELARRAYFEFLTANDFMPNTASLDVIENARVAGTVVVLFDFTNQNRYFKDFNSEIVFNELNNRFKNSNFTFLRVIDSQDQLITPDEIVVVEMDNAVISGVNTSEKITKVIKENVDIGTIKTEEGDKKVYGNVEANYREFQKSVSSSARLMIQKMDANSMSILRREVYPNTFTWVERWGAYDGDKRALNEQQLNLCLIREPLIPDPLWLFNQATAPLIIRSLNFLQREYQHLR